jgi:hypothetical protein
VGDLQIYNPEQAKSAFDATTATRAGLTREQVRRITAPRNEAAVRGLRAYEVLQQPELKALLDLVPDKLSDPQHRSELAHYAWALRYADAQRTKAGENAESVKLPQVTVSAAMALRAQMLEVIAYNLGHTPKIAELVAYLRSGTGYNDLAEDLEILAQLYQENAQELALDQRKYRPADAGEAQALVGAILRHLARDGEAGRWDEELRRCWTVFADAYEEVRRVVHFVMHDNPEVLGAFPSLHARYG